MNLNLIYRKCIFDQYIVKVPICKLQNLKIKDYDFNFLFKQNNDQIFKISSKDNMNNQIYLIICNYQTIIYCIKNANSIDFFNQNFEKIIYKNKNVLKKIKQNLLL